MLQCKLFLSAIFTNMYANSTHTFTCSYTLYHAVCLQMRSLGIIFVLKGIQTLKTLRMTMTPSCTMTPMPSQAMTSPPYSLWTRPYRLPALDREMHCLSGTKDTYNSCTAKVMPRMIMVQHYCYCTKCRQFMFVQST